MYGAIGWLRSRRLQVREFRLPKWWPKKLRPPRWRSGKEVSVAELALASAIAGGATELARTALLHPIGTVKTRLQARRAAKSRGADAGAEPRRRSALDSELWRDVYAGFGPNLFAAVPSAGVWFGVRDTTRRALLNQFGSSSAAGRDLMIALAATAAAEAAQTAARAPVDVLVTRQQVRTPRNASLGAAGARRWAPRGWTRGQEIIVRDAIREGTDKARRDRAEITARGRCPRLPPK